MRFQRYLNVIRYIESNIRALVLLNSLNLLQKRDKRLGKPHIYLFSQTRLISSIKHEGSCKILYVTADWFAWHTLGMLLMSTLGIIFHSNFMFISLLVEINKIFESKIVNIFLSISFSICLIDGKKNLMLLQSKYYPLSSYEN